VLQVVGDRSGDVRTLDSLLLVLALGGLAAVALALVGGTLYAGRALVPIRESLRRQREFAADASHELRTPLAVVRGSVEHLRRHPDDPVGTVGTALDDIDAEVDHLSALVEDLLLLARADSGAVELQPMPLDLADVTAEALGGLAGLASDRRIQLSLDAQPTALLGDAGRLRQLVAILVDNALRHGPSDATVRVHVAPERGRAVLAVQDEGRGIRPEDLPHVFERFWRAADAPPGGTGLGLSIAAWIAERHGGTISAEASERGALFVVRLPMARADAHPEAPGAPQPVH
jgi:signal transduction histidine kinase